jgi:hypothetical protein
MSIEVRVMSKIGVRIVPLLAIADFRLLGVRYQTTPIVLVDIPVPDVLTNVIDNLSYILRVVAVQLIECLRAEGNPVSVQGAVSCP